MDRERLVGGVGPPSIHRVGLSRDEYAQLAAKQQQAPKILPALPAYPLEETRSKQGPAPPKYLVRIGADAKEEVVQVLGGHSHGPGPGPPPKHRAQTGALAPARIAYPPPDARPLINKTITPLVSEEKDFGPAHRFPSRVDSSMGAKGVPLSRQALERHNLHSRQLDAAVGGGPASFGRPVATPGLRAPPSAPKPQSPAPPHPFGHLPAHAALRRFEPPTIAAQHARSPPLAKRTAAGEVLGTPDKRYVEYRHVPEGYVPPPEPAPAEADASYYQEDSGSVQTAQTAGPETPIVPYTWDPATGAIVWAQCWDDEAGAVYYFNNATGEASWLPPER